MVQLLMVQILMVIPIGVLVQLIQILELHHIQQHLIVIHIGVLVQPIQILGLLLINLILVNHLQEVQLLHQLLLPKHQVQCLHRTWDRLHRLHYHIPQSLPLKCVLSHQVQMM